MFLWLINMLVHGGTSTTAHKTVFDYFSSLIPDAVFTDVDIAFWHFAPTAEPKLQVSTQCPVLAPAAIQAVLGEELKPWLCLACGQPYWRGCFGVAASSTSAEEGRSWAPAVGHVSPLSAHPEVQEGSCAPGAPGHPPGDSLKAAKLCPAILSSSTRHKGRQGSRLGAQLAAGEDRRGGQGFQRAEPSQTGLGCSAGTGAGVSGAGVYGAGVTGAGVTGAGVTGAGGAGSVPAPRLAARPAPPRLASPRRGRRLREQREEVPARSWPRCARGRAAGAMGQLCCFPFSRGEEKIGECGGSALPCASAGCAAAPGSLRLRKAGWRARGAFLGDLLVLLSWKLTDCF